MTAAATTSTHDVHAKSNSPLPRRAHHHVGPATKVVFGVVGGFGAAQDHLPTVPPGFADDLQHRAASHQVGIEPQDPGGTAGQAAVQVAARGKGGVEHVHPEAGPHLHRTLQAIRATGAKAGVSLNPGTPAEAIDPVIDLIDLVLVMSVNPGFGGQSFIETALPKIEKLREKIDATGRDIILEVDGGVNAKNAARVVAAGATALVAGTAVYGGDPSAYAENIKRLRAAA